MGIKHTTVVSSMITKLLTASAWLCIDQDIIDAFSTALVLWKTANFWIWHTTMILFAATLPVTGLLLLHSRARLCILLVLETTTLALIVSSRRWLVKVKDTLGLV